MIASFLPLKTVGAMCCLLKLRFFLMEQIGKEKLLLILENFYFRFCKIQNDVVINVKFSGVWRLLKEKS